MMQVMNHQYRKSYFNKSKKGDKTMTAKFMEFKRPGGKMITFNSDAIKAVAEHGTNKERCYIIINDSDDGWFEVMESYSQVMNKLLGKELNHS
jgi:hypothetical protein